MALFLPLLPLLLLLAAGGQAGAPAATVQTSPDKEIATQDVQPSFSFRVQRNMVVVRVIVRDANGRPVPKLRKEDFRLLDNGKAQVIDQFAVESARAARPRPWHPASHPRRSPRQNRRRPLLRRRIIRRSISTTSDRIFRPWRAPEMRRRSIWRPR